jgi:hypothetical protein
MGNISSILHFLQDERRGIGKSVAVIKKSVGDNRKTSVRPFTTFQLYIYGQLVRRYQTPFAIKNLLKKWKTGGMRPVERLIAIVRIKLKTWGICRKIFALQVIKNERIG